MAEILAQVIGALAKEDYHREPLQGFRVDLKIERPRSHMASLFPQFMA